ncbi:MULTISPECIES: hypothetical protein [Pseudoalteromonas]|uniref:Uncharacterized protein n=1 Tax=Pseudoalteromonas amylolytica TaxID=1859457 RepID=A0A1S1MSC0_9GAMM|nr:MULTISPECIES: hypothetical protein [Pseudoalteromonas]OHU86485.1 hypothetical protein BFC16_13275 [Pseudoalteromonas sp. JW3]OHU88990.1 hypothetical protein BET10_19485 [Pseudoalteromonas amylolytica]
MLVIIVVVFILPGEYWYRTFGKRIQESTHYKSKSENYKNTLCASLFLFPQATMFTSLFSENEFEYLDIKDCLKGIVFGPRANFKNKGRALEIPDRRGFGNPMYKLDFRNCSPKIDYDWKE